MKGMYSGIDTWVFDLDDTLYVRHAPIYGEMHGKMVDFICAHLGITQEEASVLREGHLSRYGTTLRGLMTENGVEPDTFMRHTHDIDISALLPCAVTQEKLGLLPGRKVVFTNAPRQWWADRMLEHLGLTPHFDAVFAIEDAGYHPKPHPPTYKAFLEKHDIDPATACMFEDTARNLEPARALGMKTVWIHPDCEKTDYPYVQDKAATLAAWLTRNTGDTT